MFKSAMSFTVEVLVLSFGFAEGYEMLLEVCLGKEDAVAVGAFEVAVAVLWLCHVLA
jgi:hypothetical protein